MKKEQNMYLGIDIGSSSSKAVVLDEGGQIAASAVVNTGTGSTGAEQAVQIALLKAGISQEQIRKCVATGYGRMLYKGADKQITEISCHAKGVRHIQPEAKTIIDIGGQDAKVIRLRGTGAVENFIMNEKCAAGTGRFLEVMAIVLGCSLQELSDLAKQGTAGVSISSVCTVFAESEMISQLAAGETAPDVALGALQAVARRVAGMGNRIGIAPEVVMSGGAALNQALVDVMEETIGYPVTRLDSPQIMGALGAAKYAAELK